MNSSEMLQDARKIAKSLNLTVVKHATVKNGYYIIIRKTKIVEFTVKPLHLIYEQLLMIQ